MADKISAIPERFLNAGPGHSWDNIKTPGIYYLDGIDNYAHYGFMIVANNYDSKLYQVFIQNDGAVAQIRHWNGSAWGAWFSFK